MSESDTQTENDKLDLIQIISLVLCVYVLGSLLVQTLGALSPETTLLLDVQTPEDAIWWAFTTVTTVGYGDKYPVTTKGRVVAAMLMISSVGLFGIFTGFVASFFVGEDQKSDNRNIKILIEEVRLLRLRIEQNELSEINGNGEKKD